MVNRLVTKQLAAVLLATTLGLSACGPAASPSGPSKSTAQAGNTPSEIALRKQAKAMQRTIIEGALTGAAINLAVNAATSGGDRDRFFVVGPGFIAGGFVGGYVSHVQKNFSGKERQLEAVKSDLDRNAQEMQTTINVMKSVLAQQKAQLVAVRKSQFAGKASEAQVAAEVKQANANINNMQLALEGAKKRQSDLGSSRSLKLSPQGKAVVNTELASLARQVAEMRAIATALSNEV